MKNFIWGLALFAVTAVAQTDRGTITGRVTDIAGAYIAGVFVVATHLGTNTRF